VLTYDLIPLHPIDRIEFTGTLRQPGVEEGRLRRALVERYGDSPPVTRRADMSRLVEDTLRLRGYLHPHVTSEVEIFHAPDRATLTFAIEPGPRTTVGAVDVQGTAGVSSDALLNRLGVERGAPYEADEIAVRIQQYLVRESGDGYIAAKLTMTTRLVDDDRVADLTFTASRGARVRVEFAGDPIPGNEQDRLVPVAAEASADQDLLEDSSARIEDYLRGLGYRDATSSFKRTETEQELLITFTVTRGALYRTMDVQVTGNRFESLDAIIPRLSLRKGQPYSIAKLDADITAIEDYYRHAGFGGVRVIEQVDAGDGTSTAGEVPVNVRLTIDEGVRTVVNSVVIQGNASVPSEELVAGLGLQPGRPFFLTQMAVDRDAIQLQYANRGFQSASVGGNPGISDDGARADVVYTVTEGPKLVVDHVLIVGNQKTKTETIERELQLRSGDALGIAAVSESQRRLAELGLFRRIRITQVPHGDESQRDLVVSVEEAPATTVGYGGGLEVSQISINEADTGLAAEQLEVAPRAFFEVGRRNLFGKNRSINLFTRISLHPDSDGSSAFGFTEYRIFGAFREPRLFNTSADAFLTGTLEQERRSLFNFSRQLFTAEVGRKLTDFVTVSGNYAIQRTDLFDENIDSDDQLLIDRLFPQIVLSSFSGTVAQTTRDEIVSPTSGHDLTANGQVAARAIGSEVGFLKTYLTAQLFKTIPRSRGTVFATSARLGMAYGLPRTVIESPGATPPDDGEPLIGTVRDLPASERFFAGGDTTVRGFALDQLGTPDTLDKNGLALGGNAVLIFNAELRAPLKGGFGVVTFVDVGNVFKRTSDISIPDLRSSVGFGLRYRSPIGPLRVDLGFKTHRNELSPGHLESANALHISLGQAF
ncbi:MAG TPA: POTRA domain-containing protein, partial [Vicinamibacterales bacterium]|nr:POTRA domain-containing protein [Vicinamibacterales bacterium]